MCKHGTSTPMMIGGRVRDVDSCLVPLVAALNNGGIPTKSSCCGHGHIPSSVILNDDRFVVILTRQEAMKLYASYPTDIHGNPAAPPQDAPRRAISDDEIIRLIDWIRQHRATLSVAEGSYAPEFIAQTRKEVLALCASPAAPVDLSAVEAAIRREVDVTLCGAENWTERDLADFTQRIAAALSGVPAPSAQKSHRWDRGGERCLDCGAKDWMDAPCGVPAKEAGETKPDTRIPTALELARSYGGIDGAHHKMWLIDQMVRALLPNDGEYEAWVVVQKAGEDGPETYEWDEGIAP